MDASNENQQLEGLIEHFRALLREIDDIATLQYTNDKKWQVIDSTEHTWAIAATPEACIEQAIHKFEAERPERERLLTLYNELAGKRGRKPARYVYFMAHIDAYCTDGGLKLGQTLEEAIRAVTSLLKEGGS